MKLYSFFYELTRFYDVSTILMDIHILNFKQQKQIAISILAIQPVHN